MLRSNAAGTYVWFSIHDTHLSDKRVGGWDRKRGHRNGRSAIVFARFAHEGERRQQLRHWLSRSTRCVLSAAVGHVASLSHLSGLSCLSSGDSGGGELGGDSRCTITWQNLRFGSLIRSLSSLPLISIVRYPRLLSETPDTLAPSLPGAEATPPLPRVSATCQADGALSC